MELQAETARAGVACKGTTALHRDYFALGPIFPKVFGRLSDILKDTTGVPMKIMTAKYKGKCYACDVRIKVGEQIQWDAITGSKHVDCALACSQQTEADKRERESITQLGDFTDVYALFEVAAKGGKWPRITINADGYEFYLYISGAKAMIPNVINVKAHDGMGTDVKSWFGRITADGAWDQRHKEVDERMADALSKLAMDPVGTVAMYGRLSGKCCFCKKQLTDAPSVDAGYGPVCAKRWGLAWGGKHGPADLGPIIQTVTDPPEVLNSFVQAANGDAVFGTSPQLPSKAISYPNGPPVEPVVNMPEWNPDAAPINLSALLKQVEADAAAPKKTVTLKTKMVTAKVNLPECYD